MRTLDGVTAAGRRRDRPAGAAALDLHADGTVYTSRPSPNLELAT